VSWESGAATGFGHEARDLPGFPGTWAGCFISQACSAPSLPEPLSHRNTSTTWVGGLGGFVVFGFAVFRLVLQSHSNQFRPASSHSSDSSLKTNSTGGLWRWLGAALPPKRVQGLSFGTGARVAWGCTLRHRWHRDLSMSLTSTASLITHQASLYPAPVRLYCSACLIFVTNLSCSISWFDKPA
jgi:hypothetical protein